MSYFDMLKAAKIGGNLPTYYETLLARKAPCSKYAWTTQTLTGVPPINYLSKGSPLTAYTAKGAMTQAAEQQYTLTGVPPLTFSAKGTALTAYSVTGAMVQTGTPTPTEPVTPEECGDLVTTGEHAGEYCIPLTVSGTSYPLYLSEPLRKIGEYADSVDSSGVVTRRIKKVVFDGTENWSIAQSGMEKALFTVSLASTPISSLDVRRLSICTHYDDAIIYYSTTSIGFLPIEDGTIRFRPDNVASMTKNDWTTWLAAQYAANTPVCVWYVLASPVTETTTAPTITPASGSNTLTCGTTLSPSAVSLTTVGGVAPYNPIVPTECGELVESGEHAGQYKLTFTNAGNSYPVYLAEPLRKIGEYADELSSAGTVTRRIRKITVTRSTAQHGFNAEQNTFYFTSLTSYLKTSGNIALCSHFATYPEISGIANVQNGVSFYNVEGTSYRAYFKDPSLTSENAWLDFFDAQNAAGTPVYLYYVLSTPTTEQITAPEIETDKGDNIFTETSTLKPSSVSITGKIKEATA